MVDKTWSITAELKKDKKHAFKIGLLVELDKGWVLDLDNVTHMTLVDGTTLPVDAFWWVVAKSGRTSRLAASRARAKGAQRVSARKPKPKVVWKSAEEMAEIRRLQALEAAPTRMVELSEAQQAQMARGEPVDTATHPHDRRRMTR